MTDRKAELVAAAKATKDDHARLVLADFLEDSGDPRGLLVRLQCLLATLPAWDPRAVEARWEVDYLLARHGDAWRAELPKLDGVTWGELERGFVATARVPDVATLYKHEEAIGAIGTVYRVQLDRLDERTLDMPASGLPWLRSLRVSLAHFPHVTPKDSVVWLASDLELADAHYPTAAFLGQRPHKVPLERVAMTGEHPSSTALVQALANKPFARGLKRLDIGTEFVDFNTGYYEDPTLREDGAALLAGAGFEQLEALDITLQHVEASGLETIVGALPRLRELVAPGNDVQYLEFLERSVGEPIVRLDLSHNLLGDKNVQMIATAPRLEKLEVLQLDGCELHGESVISLADAHLWHSLHELDLSRNPLGVAGALALAATPRPARLHTLRLADIDQDAEAAKLLAEIEWLDQLKVFDISTNTVAAKLIASLVCVRSVRLAELKLDEALGPALEAIWPRVVHMTLAGTPLTGTELSPTGAPELQTLELARCGIHAEAIDRLLAGRYPRLRRLSLDGATFGTDTLVQLFASGLPAQLDALVLSNCELGADAAEMLGTIATGGLRTLDLRHNAFEPADLVAIGRHDSLRGVKQILLSGEPYDYPEPIRTDLAARFGQHWYYHEDEQEPPEHPYGEPETYEDEVE